MLKSLVTKLIGSHHEREAKKQLPVVAEINEHFAALRELTDEQLRAKTAEFKGRITEATSGHTEQIAALREEKRHSGDAARRAQLTQQIHELERGQLETIEYTLEDLLPEAFAVVKEACRRLVGTEVVFTGTKAK